MRVPNVSQPSCLGLYTFAGETVQRSPPGIDQIPGHSVTPSERAVVEDQSGNATFREGFRVFAQAHILHTRHVHPDGRRHKKKTEVGRGCGAGGVIPTVVWQGSNKRSWQRPQGLRSPHVTWQAAGSAFVGPAATPRPARLNVSMGWVR